MGVFDKKAFLDRDCFQVRSMLREIEKVKDMDDKHTLKGMLYACVGDKENAIHEHEVAYSLNKISNFVVANYSTSLFILGFWRKGVEIGSTLKNTGHLSLRALEYLMVYSINIGEIEQSLEYYEMAKKHINKENTLDESFSKALDHAGEAKRFLKDNNINPKQLTMICSCVEDVMKKNKLIFLESSFCTSNFYGENILHISYYVNLTAKESSDLNEKLMELIVENENIEEWDRIIPSIEPHSSSSNNMASAILA